MNPFDERFLADIQRIQDQLAKQAQLVQASISGEQIASMMRMSESVQKSVAPIQAVMSSPSFQSQMRTLYDTFAKLSAVLPFKPYITVDDFNDLNRLYTEVETIGQRIETPAPITQEEREIQIVHPLYSQTKTEIKKGRLILPLSLPSQVSWDQIRMTFVGSQTIWIEFLSINEKIIVDYTDMGMWDGRNKQPNDQWQLLMELASVGGRIDWNSSIADPKLKKRKQLLSQSLKAYFNLAGEPFKVYRAVKAYELKLHLVPLPDRIAETSSIYDD